MTDRASPSEVRLHGSAANVCWIRASTGAGSTASPACSACRSRCRSCCTRSCCRSTSSFPDALRWKARQPAARSGAGQRQDARASPRRPRRWRRPISTAAATPTRTGARRAPLPVTDPRDPGQRPGRGAAPPAASSRRSSSSCSRRRASRAPRVPTEAQRQAPAEEPPPQVSGRDLADLSLAAMLPAGADRRARSRTTRSGRASSSSAPAPREYRFAQYEEDWRAKIERVGTLNYPAEARGKLYGNLRLTVTIRPDGRWSRSSSTAPRASRCSTRRRSASCRWRRRSRRFPPTSARTPTSWSSRAPGSSRQGDKSGLSRRMSRPLRGHRQPGRALEVALDPRRVRARRPGRTSSTARIEAPLDGFARAVDEFRAAGGKRRSTSPCRSSTRPSATAATRERARARGAGGEYADLRRRRRLRRQHRRRRPGARPHAQPRLAICAARASC